MTIQMPIADIKVPAGAIGRIGKILHRGLWYEQEMLSYISTLGVTGSYIDIGANIGNHSVFFARNTAADRVFSFEPISSALDLLREFVDSNMLYEKITIVPYATSDFNGEVDVYNLPGDPPVKCRCCKVDDVISGKVGLMKLDIEGAEPYALRGAARILAEHKPVLFVEAHDEKVMEEIMAVIEPIGYKPTGKVWNHSPTYEFVAE